MVDQRPLWDHQVQTIERATAPGVTNFAIFHEPGCGKTRLAGAVAYEFTQKYLQGQKNEQGEEKWWDYYIWNIKSTTRARDGLYSYDAIARLRDAQLMGTNPQQLQEFLGDGETEQLRTRLKDKKNYHIHLRLIYLEHLLK
jgi:MoxR-like ATPase